TNKMKEWDTAASYCIITEAGGKMTDMNGGHLVYNKADVIHHDGILATNGVIHDIILSEFKKNLINADEPEM
ncbi:MAG: 3'(2'),5'-bisphosphate nucleotidase CysQ, partial [Nitrosopumilus sp. D6]